MSVISTSLRSLSAFLQDHQMSFSNGLLVLFTIGGEQIFRFNAFRCPCTQPDAYYYAVIFMLVPALILGILGVAVSNLTWRIFHGCRHRSDKSQNGCSKSLEYFCIALARAAIVPCAWLFITLLDGNYYACMRAENPCQTNSDEYKVLLAESQNISWISLGGLVCISFIVICLVRCCDSVTYVQSKYLSAYREAELNHWDNLIQEYTGKLAETNVREFMDQPLLKKKDWDDVSEAPDHKIPLEKEDDIQKPAPPGKKSALKVFFTPLHKWASLHNAQQKEEEEQLETSPV